MCDSGHILDLIMYSDGLAHCPQMYCFKLQIGIYFSTITRSEFVVFLCRCNIFDNLHRHPPTSNLLPSQRCSSKSFFQTHYFLSPPFYIIISFLRVFINSIMKVCQTWFGSTITFLFPWFIFSPPSPHLLALQFGKVIQSQQVPGWSTYYLDYKFLKKIISSLAANRPAFEAAALARGVKPQDILLSSLSAPGSQLASPIPATNVDSNNQSTNTSGTGALSTTSIAHALSLEASLILPPPSIVLPPSSTTLSPLSLPDPTSVSPPSAVGIGAIQNATGGNMSVQQQDARAHKAAFFFKLERELEKVCEMVPVYRAWSLTTYPVVT